MKRPVWQILLDGRAVDTRRLINLSITDNKGLELDTVQLTLSDAGGMLDIPKKGVTLSVSIGYAGESMVDRGTFVIGEVAHTGPPDYLILGGKSGDMDGSGIKEGKEKNWRKTTIGAIIKSIASTHKLEAVVNDTLANVAIEHMNQTESDAHFLTRLGEEHDAIATIKAGRLVFAPKGDGKSATGRVLPAVLIRRTDQDTHDWKAADSGRYTGVRASWHSSKKGKRENVVVGQDGYCKRLSDVFANQERAKTAAQAEWNRLSRGLATIDLALAYADPNLFAETPISLSGWGKPEIDNSNWVVTKVQLDINDSGLSAKLSAETKTP